MKNIFLILFISFLLVGCKNPLGSGDSRVDSDYETDNPVPTPTPAPDPDISMTIPYDAGSEASYDISSLTSVEFVSGVARLKSSNQTDNDNTATEFGAASMSSVVWDGSFVRLNATTNTAEMDSSWAPRWNNIVGYWKMNGTVGAIANGAVIPATVGTNGVAVRGTALSYVDAKMNQGMSFAAGGDTMRVSTPLPITNKYTFSFWVYVVDFPATISAPISTSLAGALRWEIFFNTNYVAGGYPAWGIQAVEIPTSKKSGSALNTFTTTDLGSWQHIALVYDATAGTKTKIYKGGRLLAVGLDQMDVNFPSHDTFWVGGVRGDGNGCCNTNGRTDEFAVWDVPLTATEVKTIYERQSAKYSGQIKSRVMDAFVTGQTWESIDASTTLPFYKELIGYSNNETIGDYTGLTLDMTQLEGLWHLDELVGTTGAGSVTDRSGYTRSGTPTNTSFGSPGKLSTSVYLGGSGFIGISNASGLNNTASVITVSAWINTTVANNGKIFSSKDGANGYQLYVNATGKITTWSDTGGILVGNATLTDGDWHHLVAVWNGASVTHYVDGKFDSSGARSFQAQTKANQIGTECSGINSTVCSTYFNGRIDEVAIWKKPLNAADVLQLYRRGANRLKYQVRTCNNTNCTDQDALVLLGQGWKGPDNSHLSYFSELHNNININSAGNPIGDVKTPSLGLSFDTFTAAGTGLSIADNRYFQYRAILESDDKNTLCTYGVASSCSPELKAVSIGPDHYHTTAQTVTSHSSLGTAYATLTANGFTETGGACTAGLRYALSGDGITYYYWDGATWAISTNYATASSAAVISANLATFADVALAGTLQVKTFLKSDGTSPCAIDSLLILGKE